LCRQVGRARRRGGDELAFFGSASAEVSAFSGCERDLRLRLDRRLFGLATGVRRAEGGQGGGEDGDASHQQRPLEPGRERGRRGGGGGGGRAGVRVGGAGAPRSHCEALSSAAASPALSLGTPALAAVATATKRPAMPRPTSSRPGSRSVVYEPPTGMRDSQ